MTGTAATRARHGRRLSAAQIEQIIELRESRGLSYSAIARRIGCSHGSVEYHCLRAGVVRDSDGPIPIRPVRDTSRSRAFTEADDARMIAMEAEGARVADIARALGRAHNSVASRLYILARRDERGVAPIGMAA